MVVDVRTQYLTEIPAEGLDISYRPLKDGFILATMGQGRVVKDALNSLAEHLGGVECMNHESTFMGVECMTSQVWVK